jgi:hypothetical protein
MEVTADENTIYIADTIEDYHTLAISGIFVDDYSKMYIEVNLLRVLTPDSTGIILKGYASQFEMFHPISFGNWGLVGFILDRLHKTDMTKNNQYQCEPPIEEFNQLYNQWFSTEKLVSDVMAEMSYQEFLGVDSAID